MYTNAAPDVIKFIDEQKKNGNLIDIYSDVWQKKQHIKFEFYRKNLQTFEKKYGYSYKQYVNDIKKGRLPKTIVKVWTGR